MLEGGGQRTALFAPSAANRSLRRSGNRPGGRAMGGAAKGLGIPFSSAFGRRWFGQTTPTARSVPPERRLAADDLESVAEPRRQRRGRKGQGARRDASKAGLERVVEHGPNSTRFNPLANMKRSQRCTMIAGRASFSSSPIQPRGPDRPRVCSVFAQGCASLAHWQAEAAGEKRGFHWVCGRCAGWHGLCAGRVSRPENRRCRRRPINRRRGTLGCEKKGNRLCQCLRSSTGS